MQTNCGAFDAMRNIHYEVLCGKTAGILKSAVEETVLDKS